VCPSKRPARPSQHPLGFPRCSRSRGADSPNGTPTRREHLQSQEEVRWAPEREDLETAEEGLSQLTQRILADTQFEPNPGPHCRWCPWQLVCDAAGRVDPADLEPAGDLPFGWELKRSSRQRPVRLHIAPQQATNAFHASRASFLWVRYGLKNRVTLTPGEASVPAAGCWFSTARSMSDAEPPGGSTGRAESCSPSRVLWASSSDSPLTSGTVIVGGLPQQRVTTCPVRARSVASSDAD
jgi:hypothetical protein